MSGVNGRGVKGGRAATAFAFVLAVTVGTHAGPRDPSSRQGPNDRAVKPDAPPSAALALASLDRKLADLDAAEVAEKKELEALGGRIAEAHVRAVERGRAFYKLTRAGMLPVGGGFDALVTHAMHVERARRGLASDLASERTLRARGAELAFDLERVAKDKAALSAQRSAMDAANAAMADDARRQAAFAQAFESSSGASEYVAVTGGAAPADPSGGVGFAAAKGRLLFPLLGHAADVRRARRSGGDGPGLDIRAPLGTTVRSVYAGRVAFADRYGSYGRILILDHGDHFYTVSGNLASIDVRVGDEVSAGEKIGSVGDEGQGPLLYFEVRRGSQTLDPSPWLGL